MHSRSAAQDLLAAIPSVVYGLWGILVLAPFLTPSYRWLNENLGWVPVFGGQVSATGRTMLTVGIVLAIMVLPIMAALIREVFLQTPRLHEEAALALGATRWEMIKMAVLPFGRPGIISAAMLGLGRALGETMAVAMVLSPSSVVSFALLTSQNPNTIAANIAYGHANPDKAAVEKAAKAANAWDFISALPQGLDTLVGEAGMRLSGGQRQRISIARAIFKNAPILILDEATSSLDTKTEQDINQALDFVLKDRTAVIIAHRLSTIVTADEIIVLDKGQIAERGTHQNLLAQNGLYQKMWNRQQASQEVEQKLKSLT